MATRSFLPVLRGPSARPAHPGYRDRGSWRKDSEFKELVTMATDPVCGMAVEREKAAANLAWQGETNYFCSPGCRAEFESTTAAAAREGGSHGAR